MYNMFLCHMTNLIHHHRQKKLSEKSYVNSFVVAIRLLYRIPVPFSLNPLFPGTNELDQVTKIHDVLGTPDLSLLQKFKQWVFLLKYVVVCRVCLLVTAAVHTECGYFTFMY